MKALALTLTAAAALFGAAAQAQVVNLYTARH